jgi:hypothetical protein
MANDTFSVYDESQPTEAKQFCKDFLNTEVGKRFSKLYDSESAQEAWDGVIAKYRRIYGDDPITLGDLRDFVSDLLLSGALRAQEPPAPKEKQLSPSQQKWSEYRTFSEQNDMNACRARAAKDPGYANYIHKTNERDLAATQNQVPDAGINLNEKTPATTKFVSQEVTRFVEDYRTMPIARIKLMSSPGTNPAGVAGAQHWNSLFTQACNAGLI